MGGGLLQLVAYGAQDAYISGNPHITFWKTLYKRHTNFAMEAFRVNFTGTPSYGQRMVAVVNRNADLIWKTYVQVVLPDTSVSAVPGGAVSWTGDTQRRLGYALLKKIELEIGGQIIDTQYGEWLFLWENLTADFDTSFKLDSMLGGPLVGNVTTQTSCGGRPGVLYIPLQFWFNRNPGLALPLIALQYHEVRFNIYLSKATDLVTGYGSSPNYNLSTAAAALPQIKDMSLYIDYIYLDVDERRRFAQESHEYLIDQVQTGLQQTITSANARIDLTLNHPVKELVWVFQDVRKLDCASTVSSTVGYTQPFSYDDIVDKCRLQINGQDRFDERYGDYFFKVQPYQHHTGGAFWPVRNKVAFTGVYSAAGTPTGLGGSAPQATFSGSITGSTLTITGSFVGGPITENMLVVGTGVPQGTFIVDYGTGAGGGANNATYELSQSVSGTVTGSMAAFAPNVQNNNGYFNPINVYSFALRPEEHQPTGTCNFSRIDTATLVFDSITSGGAGTYPSKAYPYAFRIYAVNYNILRIMSGMGGLAYSN
jgi:Major capsid protein N-terminus/Large eukaryotic DNA virus major capsid protein